MPKKSRRKRKTTPTNMAKKSSCILGDGFITILVSAFVLKSFE